MQLPILEFARIRFGMLVNIIVIRIPKFVFEVLWWLAVIQRETFLMTPGYPAAARIFRLAIAVDEVRKLRPGLLNPNSPRSDPIEIPGVGP